MSEGIVSVCLKRPRWAGFFMSFLALWFEGVGVCFERVFLLHFYAHFVERNCKFAVPVVLNSSLTLFLKVPVTVIGFFSNPS